MPRLWTANKNYTDSLNANTRYLVGAANGGCSYQTIPEGSTKRVLHGAASGACYYGNETVAVPTDGDVSWTNIINLLSPYGISTISYNCFLGSVWDSSYNQNWNGYNSTFKLYQSSSGIRLNYSSLSPSGKTLRTNATGTCKLFREATSGQSDTQITIGCNSLLNNVNITAVKNFIEKNVKGFVLYIGNTPVITYRDCNKAVFKVDDKVAYIIFSKYIRTTPPSFNYSVSGTQINFALLSS